MNKLERAKVVADKIDIRLSRIEELLDSTDNVRVMQKAIDGMLELVGEQLERLSEMGPSRLPDGIGPIVDKIRTDHADLCRLMRPPLVAPKRHRRRRSRY
jgi:hypothetical protein